MVDFDLLKDKGVPMFPVTKDSTDPVDRVLYAIWREMWADEGVDIEEDS